MSNTIASVIDDTRVSNPVLYSFRRCPYAIRARLAIVSAGICVSLREVVLKDKPTEMLAVSAKATVPVLVLADGTVIDESRDIMQWALLQNDTGGLLRDDLACETEALWQLNDFEFKPCLDRYKYADRHLEKTPEQHRQACETFLADYDQRISEKGFLLGSRPTLIDLAIFPFVRQCAFVDKNWFDQTDYAHLQQWLNYWLETLLFLAVMNKYPQWQPSQPGVVFPEISD